MKIKLQEALDLVEAADIVRLTDMDGYLTPSISIDDIVDDPANQVMYVTWDDDEGLEYSFKVTEGNNYAVEREGHKLTFIDNEGEPFELQLFREVPILP